MVAPRLGEGMPIHRPPRSQPGDAQRTYKAGEVIVQQGDDDAEMYVVQSGAVEISQRSASGRVVLATLGPTEFFGEMSLLESLPRDADAIALTDVDVLVITQGGLLLRLRRDPSFALEMLHQLSSRVRALNAQLDRK
jgi:CRP-like cAMP-binding protein